MADHGVKLDTLKDCLQYLEWLNDGKQEVARTQLAGRLYRLLDKKYKSVDREQIENALSDFLSSVSNIHNKLCNKAGQATEIPKTTTPALNALLDCIPKMHAAFYFLRYRVDKGFEAMGGGDWASEPVGQVTMYARSRQPPNVYMRFASKIDAYLITPNGDTYGVIPGGFNPIDLKPLTESDYSQIKNMAMDLGNLLDKTRQMNNLFLDVYSTTVVGTHGTDTANVANALRLVRDFCRIFAEVEDEEDFKSHLYTKEKCINYNQLKSHCAQLKDPLERIFKGERFSFTGYGRLFNDLNKQNIAKKMASWFRTNLETVKKILEKIKPLTSIKPQLNSKHLRRGSTLPPMHAKALNNYFTQHFFRYGFTFHGHDFNKWDNGYHVLTKDWDGVINLLQKSGNGLDKLVKILNGDKCRLENEKEQEREAQKGKPADETEDGAPEPPAEKSKDESDVESEDDADEDLKEEEDTSADKTEAAKPVVTKTEAKKSEASKPPAPKVDGSPNLGTKSEGAQNQGKKAEGAPNQGKKTEGAQNQGKKAEGAPNQGKKTEGAQNQGKKSEGAQNQGKKAEGAQNQGKKAEGAQNQGKKSEGAQNQGKKAEGAQNQAKKSEGAQNQGKKAEGAQNQGKKAEGAQNQGKKVEGTSNQSSAASEATSIGSQVAQAAQINDPSVPNSDPGSSGDPGSSSSPAPGGQAAAAKSVQESGRGTTKSRGADTTTTNSPGSDIGGAGGVKGQQDSPNQDTSQQDKCYNGEPPIYLGFNGGGKYCPQDGKTWDLSERKKMHDDWEATRHNYKVKLEQKKKDIEDKLRKQKEAEERRKEAEQRRMEEQEREKEEQRQRQRQAMLPEIDVVFDPQNLTAFLNDTYWRSLQNQIKDSAPNLSLEITKPLKSDTNNHEETPFVILHDPNEFGLGGTVVSDEDGPVVLGVGGEPVFDDSYIKMQQGEDSKYNASDKQLQDIYHQRHEALQKLFEDDMKQRAQAERQLMDLVPPDAFDEVGEHVEGEAVIGIDDVDMRSANYPVVVGVESAKLPNDYDSIHDQQDIANVHDAYTKVYKHRKSEDDKIEARLQHAQQVGVMHSLNDNDFGEVMRIPSNPKSYVPESWITHYVDRIPKPIPPMIEMLPNRSRSAELTGDVSKTLKYTADRQSFPDLHIHIPKSTLQDSSYDIDLEYDHPPLPQIEPIDPIGSVTPAIKINLAPPEPLPDLPNNTASEYVYSPSTVGMCISSWTTSKPTDNLDIPETEMFPAEAPRTVRDMLQWLAGLRHPKHHSTLTECFNKAFSGPHSDPSQLALSVNGSHILPQHVIDTIHLTAMFAGSVLTAIAPRWRENVSSKTVQPRSPDEPDCCALLCQLRDYVYSCHHQLEFLKAQCKRDKLSGGCQNCEYGSDISSPNSPLQSFLTDGWDCTFETHPFDQCNLCLKSRVKMGFKADDLPKISQLGSVISTILTPSCGGSDPLLTLASYLNCFTRRTPRTTGELVSFFHHFGMELHDYDQTMLSSLGSSLSTPHHDCPDWDHLGRHDLVAVKGIRGSETLTTIHNSKHDHPRTLSTLVGCGSDSANCHPHCSPITYRAYALYSQSFAHTYISWTVYLPDRLHESLQKLHYDLLKHCGSSKCTSLYSCSTALPLLYLHGFTPPEGRSQLPLKCSDVIAKLEEIVNGGPMASLMTAMDNFLFTIREPFIFTLVALWSLAFLIFANTMLYRIDVLHIRSHLIRTKTSHLIDVKALLSDNTKMLPLYDANYFDDDSNELLNLR